MNLPKTSTWKFIVLPALAMSLGWGLRGQIGHSTGAMIPRAFVALVLCSLEVILTTMAVVLTWLTMRSQRERLRRRGNR